MDTAGIDPYEAEDEYRQLAKEKRSLLQAQLAQAQLSLETIHLVVPDGGGRVGNRTEVQQESYEGSRAWDGMADLAASLSALPTRLARLREAAGVRFFLYMGQRALSLACEAQAAYRAQEQRVQRNCAAPSQPIARDTRTNGWRSRTATDYWQ